MTSKSSTLPTLLATSVVRGSQQGDSHGGVYRVDFSSQDVVQEIDWNTTDIDFTGRGWDRGLRGIEYSRQNVYIAASDELFIFNKYFELQNSFRNPFLKHAHEICKKNNLLFITSTAYDSLLVFDIQKEMFIWGLYISRNSEGWQAQAFNPNSADGPAFQNNFHLNAVYVDDSGVYISGLNTKALLYVDKNISVSEICSLPEGVHNARPYKDGVLFNDTRADCVRYAGREESERVFKIPKYEQSKLLNMSVDESKVARQGFARGLCALADDLIAVGSSPSTISIYEFDSAKLVASVNLTMDVRNAIHGLELWPFNSKKQS